MKTFFKQALLLGGMYFIISSLLNIFENALSNVAGLVLFVVFIIFIVILAFKKSFKYLEALKNKYQKICIYLMSLGVVEYSIMFSIMPVGAISGYQSTIAAYNNVEYISPFASYLFYASICNLIILVGSILVATYLSFFKAKVI